MRRFGALYADPPWLFLQWTRKGYGRSALNHYPLLTLDQIKSYKLPPMADDSALFLWTTDPLLAQAMEVMKAWGFDYKTIAFTWVKTDKKGGFPIGLGYWTRANPEICLLGTRGKPPRMAKDVRKLIIAPREAHSAKPIEVNHRIERLVRGPYVELFARRKVAGWTCLGDELDPLAARTGGRLGDGAPEAGLPLRHGHGPGQNPRRPD